MPGWVFYQARPLWTISVVGGGALANERVANIANPNPLEVNGWFTNPVFGFESQVDGGFHVTTVRIYGSLSFSSAGVIRGFPPAGTAAEAICSIAPAAALLVNQGLIRPIGLNISTGGTVQRLTLLPRFLLLEYSSAVGGAGTTIFNVWLMKMGPQVGGTE